MRALPIIWKRTRIGTRSFAAASDSQQDSLPGFDRVEVNPAGLALVQEIATRLRKRGGAALIIDYGEDRTYADSLQAVRQHQFFPVLEGVGTADVSTSVDFRSLRRAALAAPNHDGGSSSSSSNIADTGAFPYNP